MNTESMKAAAVIAGLTVNLVLAVLAWHLIHRNPVLGLPVMLAAGAVTAWATEVYEKAAGR